MQKRSSQILEMEDFLHILVSGFSKALNEDPDPIIEIVRKVIEESERKKMKEKEKKE